jgi:hypothetical protein
VENNSPQENAGEGEGKDCWGRGLYVHIRGGGKGSKGGREKGRAKKKGRREMEGIKERGKKIVEGEGI